MNKRQIRLIYAFTIVMLALSTAILCFICLPENLKIISIAGMQKQCVVPKALCLTLPLAVSVFFSYLLYKKRDHTAQYFYMAVFGLIMQVINFMVNI